MHDEVRLFAIATPLGKHSRDLEAFFYRSAFDEEEKTWR
jgi:hypothetical protein